PELRDEAPAPALVTTPKAENFSNGPELRTFADVVKLAGAKRDAKLRVELESYVHLISFAPGRIELRFHEKAPADLAGRLTQRLKEWTGRQWVVSLSADEGAPTMRDARTAEAMAHPLVQKALEIFPGAEIIAIREPEGGLSPDEDDAAGEDD
ncbi:MAG TPA: hypothetical protein VNH64_10775, partial [Parvularculaceae bacterium]|nr:hypothetical protein [Parvularculaceae bacterium]